MEITSQAAVQAHGHFEEGDYFGPLSLLLEEPRTATVRTEGYCEIFVLETEDFVRIHRDYPEFHDVLKQASAPHSARNQALLLDGVTL